MGLFSKISGAAKRVAIQAALDGATSTLIGKAEKYATVQKITCNDDLSISATGTILGMSESITVTIQKITIAEDGSWFCVESAKASVLGINNAIANKIVGKRFNIPEKYHMVAVGLRKVLL